MGTQLGGSSLSMGGGLLEGLERGRTQEDSPKLLRQRRGQRHSRQGAPHPGTKEVREGIEHIRGCVLCRPGANTPL